MSSSFSLNVHSTSLTTCSNIAVTFVLQAVAQTANIEKGNVQLTKALKISTSARKYTAVLMVVASLLVLGFDWYAS